jgi:hypothetical protein
LDVLEKRKSLALDLPALPALDGVFVFYTIATSPASSSPTLYRFFALDSSYSTAVQAVLFPSRTAVPDWRGGGGGCLTVKLRRLNPLTCALPGCVFKLWRMIYEKSVFLNRKR